MSKSLKHLSILGVLCVMLSCKSDFFTPKGTCIALKEVNAEMAVAVYMRNESSSETSDYWTNYVLEVFSPRDGKLMLSQRFSCDARNDKKTVLNICEENTLIHAEELTLLSHRDADKILYNKDIISEIERVNPQLKGQVSGLNVFNTQSVNVTSRQGDVYTLNLRNFQVSPLKNEHQSTDTNQAFNAKERMPGDFTLYRNSHLLFNYRDSMGLVFEEYLPNNQSKMILNSYRYKMVYPDAPHHNIGSENNPNAITVMFAGQPNEPYKDIELSSKKALMNEGVLLPHVIGLTNDCLYYSHLTELGEEADEILSCYDLRAHKTLWSANLRAINPQYRKSSLETRWAKDRRAIYCINFSENDNNIMKINALTGQVIYERN